jgi:hypothetical protein
MEIDKGPRKRTAGEARADAAAKRKDAVVTASMARAILRRTGYDLHAEFPNQNGDRSKGPVRISFLLKLDPEVATAIAEGYTMHCLNNVKSADRRRDIAGNLNRGLMSYLERPEAEFPTLADLDERFLHRFKAWLDDDDRDGFLANQVSRSELLSALQLSLGQLMKSREWKTRLSPKLRLISKPYPKMSRDISHTPPLGEPEYERLYTGTAAEIGRTVALRQAQMNAMDALDGDLVTLTEAGASPAACAAWLDANHEHPVPSYYDLGRTDAAYVRNVPAAVHAEAERILYPDLDEIVPMVLVVTAFFALNPSTAFKLRKGGHDYKISGLGDLRRLRMYPNKKRASLRQRNVLTVTDHPDNPGRVLEYLERRTERLGRARPEIASRAFARFSFETRKAVSLNTSDESWKEALKRFADKYKLPEFTLDQLRPTTLDLVHELSGGNIIAMQGVATHTNAQTTYTFYTSEAQRLRNREKLGELLMQMQRYALKDGKIRPEDLPPGIAAHAAATPGFSCIDPKDSPIDGQVRGELCAAYGRCPECPLAIVDPTSPRSLAYLMMLNKRITEASEKLPDPVAFHMRWAPVQMELLTYWMRGWPKELVEQARQIPIPELPAVE